MSKHPASILWNDFDGIGQLSSRECSKKCKELPISARGFGGICDTSTIALAITLGVIPSAMYIDNGRLHVSFTRTAKSVNLDDVIRMLKDPNMRRRDNTNAVATLICQLDNRAEILANIDAMRKKVRLIGDGGETQVMFEQGKLKEKDKAKIKDLFS